MNLIIPHTRSRPKPFHGGGPGPPGRNHINKYTCKYTYTYTYTIYTYTYTHVYIYIYIYYIVYIYIYMYLYANTYTCTCTRAMTRVYLCISDYISFYSAAMHRQSICVCTYSLSSHGTPCHARALAALSFRSMRLCTYELLRGHIPHMHHMHRTQNTAWLHKIFKACNSDGCKKKTVMTRVLHLGKCRRYGSNLDKLQLRGLEKLDREN